MFSAVSSKVKLTDSAEAGSDERVRRTFPLTLVGLGTALVLVTYVVPMATMPRTAADLGSGAAARSWILSSMSVGLAAALLASGAVGDAIGRRRTYVAGLLAMGLGSLGAGLAQNSATFVAFRVVEGLGGAAILACGLAILAHCFHQPHERAHATAICGASVGLGITTGVVLAAALDVGTGWRETYVVVAVVGLALVVPSMRLLPESSAADPRRIDVPGVVTLGAAMTLLVVALTQGRSGLDPAVITMFALALFLLVAFAVIEVRTREPMIEPALLRSPGFLAATIGSLVLGGGIISQSSNVPTVVQLGLGGSLWAASGLLLVWSVTSVATSLVVRRVRVRLSGPYLIAVSLLVVGVGQLLGLGLDVGSSVWRLVPSLLVAGLATGVLNAVLGREAVANVPPDRAAMGSGSNNTARYLGAACGITVFSVIATHAGSGTGPAKLVAGWDVAVVVASAITLVGALLIALAGRAAGRAGR
jgi:MFS family permease